MFKNFNFNSNSNSSSLEHQTSNRAVDFKYFFHFFTFSLFEIWKSVSEVFEFLFAVIYTIKMTLSTEHVEGPISRLQYKITFTNITAK